MTKIRIAQLHEGRHEFHLEPEPEELELAPESFSDIDLDVRLDVHRKRIQVHFDVSATASLECDRTLEMFDEKISGEYDILYAWAAFPEEEQEDVDDFVVLHASQQELDLTREVRDTLLLALPIRRISPKAREMDLPTQFGGPGEDDPVDPRWDALRKLKK